MMLRRQGRTMLCVASLYATTVGSCWVEAFRSALSPSILSSSPSSTLSSPPQPTASSIQQDQRQCHSPFSIIRHELRGGSSSCDGGHRRYYRHIGRPHRLVATALASAVIPFQNVTTATASTPDTTTKSEVVPAKSASASTRTKTATLASSFTASLNNVGQQQQQEQRKQDNIVLLKRSTIVALSCISTWLMTKRMGMTIVHASSIQGIAASFLLRSPAYVTASFCGSFAGMSAHLLSASHAALMGVLCAFIFAIWEAGPNKIQAGKGGRLGTIAFLSNLLLVMALDWTQFMSTITHTIETVGAFQLAIIAACGVIVKWTRNMTSTSTTIPSIAASKLKQQQLFWNKHALVIAAKITIATTLLVRLAQPTIAAKALSSLTNRTFWFMLGSALFVKKMPGNVLTLVGLIGSIFGSTTTAASMYVGAFIGMTGFTNFTIASIAQSSFLASILLQLGILNGFGGKLGLLAFLGVNFAI